MIVTADSAAPQIQSPEESSAVMSENEGQKRGWVKLRARTGEVARRQGRDSRRLDDGCRSSTASLSYPELSILPDQHVREIDYSQYAHAHCNPDAEFLSCLHLEPPEDLPREQSQYEIEQCRVSRRTHAKDGIYLWRPACAFEVWIPSLGHWCTAKPEEQRVQIHGDVGGDDEEPQESLHITVHEF